MCRCANPPNADPRPAQAEYLEDSSCTSIQEHLDLGKTLKTLQATQKPSCNNYGKTRFSGSSFLHLTVWTHTTHLTVSIPLFSVYVHELTPFATKHGVIFCLMPPVTAPGLPCDLLQQPRTCALNAVPANGYAINKSLQNARHRCVL